MTETLAGVSPSNTEELPEERSLSEAAVEAASDAGPAALGVVDAAEPSEDELAITRELVRSARARGVAMTGPGGTVTRERHWRQLHHSRRWSIDAPMAGTITVWTLLTSTTPSERCCQHRRSMGRS
jgi:hypothetical protein